GRAVVALESTLLAHGLPAGRNREVAAGLEDAVRRVGAVPATVAVLDGQVRVGLDAASLDRVCGGGLVKLSQRDLGPAQAARLDGATTVAATAAVAVRAGIRAFATGGIGGVHRGARQSWDESADLAVLASTPILVVCSGVKSILDVGATLERLETLSVTVLGYRTDRFPGFYLADSGHPVPWRVDDPAQAAAVLSASPGPGAVVLAHPVAVADQLDPAAHDQALDRALAAAEEAGVAGKDVTPFLLERFRAETGGASLEANISLVLANARLAAEVAAHL
ncbi:MAG: pseudouridine-5'-phosphate glycosidase, partial [Acidimicrobiales bacterium]